MGLKENNGRSSYSSMLAGAIFMCNSSTMKDCFSQQLFGLPSDVRFLNKIRVGTVLFLFEYQERKLYGVFEATCNGAQNIVPHAFTSSRNFSAQVRFKTRWHCYPLNEKEFYPAIKENYYSYKKFHLDLSGKQVQKLLNLFVKKMKRKEKRPLGIEISSPARSGFEFNQCLVSPHKMKKKQIDTQTCQEFPFYEYSKRFTRSFSERDDSYSVIPEEKFLSEAQKHHSFRINDNDLHSHLQDTCELYENVVTDFPCVQPSAISSRDIIVELPSQKFVCTSHLCSEPAYLPLTDSYASKADMDIHPLQNFSSSVPSCLAVSNTDTGNYYDQTIYDSYFRSTQAAFSNSENILRHREKKFVLADDVQNHSRSSDDWEIDRGQLEEFQFEDNSRRVQYLECNHGNLREFHFDNHPRRLRYLETKHDKSRKFQNEMNPNSSQYKETEPYSSREFLFEDNFDVKMELDDTIPLNVCDYEKKVQHMRLARHERIRHATDVKKMQKSESMHRQKTSVFSRLSITKNVKQAEEDLMMMNGDFTVGQKFYVSKQKNKRENTDGDYSVNQIMIRDRKKPNKSEKTSSDALVDQSLFHTAKQKYKLENKDAFSVDQTKCCDAKKKSLENKDGIFSVDQTKCCDAKQKDKLVKTSVSESMSCAAEMKNKSVSCAVNQKNYMEKTECDLLVDQRIQSKHCVAKKKYKLQNTDVAFSPNPSISCASELKNKLMSWAVNQENNMEKTECDLLVDQGIQSKHCVAKKKYKLQNNDVFSPDPSMSCAAKQKNKLKRVKKNGSLPSSLAKQVVFSDHLERSEGFNFKRRSKIQKENEGEVCMGDECFSGKQQKRKLTRPSFCHGSFENDSSNNQFVQLMDEHISCAEGSSDKQKRRKLTRPSFGYVSCENDTSRNRDGQLLTNYILVPETSIYHVCENKDENTITRNEDRKSMEQGVLVKKYFFEKPGAEKDFSSPCANQDENVNNRINKFWARNVLLGAETYAGQVGENDVQNANDKSQDTQVMDSLFHRVGSGTKIDKDENSKRSSPTFQYMDQPILGMECSLYNAGSENKDIIVNGTNQDGQDMDQQILDMKRPFLNIACSETGFDQVCLNKDKNANQQILDKCPFHQIACAETGFCQLRKNKDKNANRNNQNGHPFDQQILGTKCSLDNASAELVSCQICENKDGEANIWNQDGQHMHEQVLGRRVNEDIKNGRVCDKNNLGSNSKNQDGQLVDQHSLPQGWASHGSANIMSSQAGNCYIDKTVTNNYVTEGSSQKLLVKETSKIFEKCKEHSEVKCAGASCKQDGFHCELLEGVLGCDKTLEEGELRSCDQTLEECESLEGFGFIENDNEVTVRGLSTDNMEPALPLCCADLPDFHCNLVDSCNTSSYAVTADPAVEISPKKNIKEELDYFHARKSIWNLCDKTSLSIELHPSYYGSDDPFVSVGGQKEVKVEKGLIKHSEKIGNEIDVMKDLNSNFLGTEVLADGDCVGEVENSWQYIKAASPLN